MAERILPGKGRWQPQADGGVVAAGDDFACGDYPSTASRSPSPSGGGFLEAAFRLAGQAGVAFGWAPDTFWNATPAELAALTAALAGEQADGADRATLAQLMEAFPDG